MSIAMLCPTHWRPELCREMLESVKANTADISDITFYFCLDNTDDIKPYQDLFSSIKDLSIAVCVYRQWTLSMCFNRLAEDAKGHDLYCLISDDCRFGSYGWDRALKNSYESLSNKIHMWCLQYNLDWDGTAFPILSKEFIHAMGWVVPPLFAQYYCDTWLGEIARANNCLTYLRDFNLVHEKKHPLGQGRELNDDVRRRAVLSRDSYVNDTCKHFLEYEKQRLAKAMQ